MTWQLVDLSDPTAREAARIRSEAILAADPRRHVFHELDWMLDASGRGPEAVRAFFLESPTGTVGYAPFTVQSWRLRFRLGELTVFSRRLARLHLIGGPLLGPPGNAQETTEPAADLLRAVRRHLESGQVVFLEGIPISSPLGRLLTENPRGRIPFHVVPYGAPFPRHFIRLPASLDDYLKMLGKRTREGLRRQHRKLLEHADGALELRAVTRPDEVDGFVEAAVAVSRKTYQWHLLGLGLRDPDRLKRTLKILAEKGWTRCYLLEIGGEPAAFMIGYHYRDTYHYIDVGFDPAWKPHSVGTVMHLTVIQDLLASEDRPELFDFSTGTGVHKERFGTESRPEVNLLLIPRGLRGWWLARLFRITEGASGALVRLVERLGIKTVVKRGFRSLSTRRKIRPR